MDGQREDVIPLDWAGDVLPEHATDDECDLEWTELFWSDYGADYADEEEDDE